MDNPAETRMNVTASLPRHIESRCRIRCGQCPTTLKIKGIGPDEFCDHLLTQGWDVSIYGHALCPRCNIAEAMPGQSNRLTTRTTHD